ncbi:MAG: hypothetical protein MZV64_54310 [Ignavibacteriales bacterium]|nr:hypothetical protein [Ignavibacteriales bacterium]
MRTQKAKDVVARLKKQVSEEKSFAFWGGEEWHYRWQNDNVQGTAFAVKAILNVEGNSDLIAKAVRWLLHKETGLFVEINSGNFCCFVCTN